MRKNHKIKAALFAGLAGTMMLGSCLTAYAAGVTKANGKLYYYQADGSLANGLIHDTASDKYYWQPCNRLAPSGSGLLLYE